MKSYVQYYNEGQQALKDGATVVDIRTMAVLSTLLKARMEIKDDEQDKLDQLAQTISEQFKSITGVKVSS